MLQIFKHPVFAVITLLLAFFCFIIYIFIPDYHYSQSSGKVQLTNPEDFCTSNDGWTAIADARESIYCIDDNSTLVYAVDINQFPYENAEIIDITFNSDNHLFCHIAVYNENSYLTDLECIFEIDSTGNILHEITHYDYRETNNPPSHQVRLMGMHFYEEELHYLYKEDNTISLMEINPDTPQHNNIVSFANNDYSEIMKCHGTSDGKFIILKNNGEIGFIYYDGEYQNIYKAQYNIHTNEGLFPYDICAANDKIYMLAGQEELSLYEWNEENDWNLLLPLKKSIQMPETTSLYSFGLRECGHNIVIQINESLFILEDRNNLTPYPVDFSLPAVVNINMWLKAFLPLFGILFLHFGIPSGIGNIMKWQLQLTRLQRLSLTMKN